ncbi:PocR ligand-binding domain-containing protein [bacterium]|nr:PocR ligand-binding domain-containing protein [bacterium]
MERSSALERAIKSISKLSGMGICIYDMVYFSYQLEELSLNWYFKSHNSPLCILTKLNSERHRGCIMIEHNRLYKAMNQEEGFCIEKCHSGLVDIVIPIKLNNKLIGGIFLGQVFLEEIPPFSLYESLFGKDENIDLRDIKREIKDVPIKSYEELLYWAEIGKVLATFIAREVEFHELKSKNKEFYYISKLDHLAGLSEPIQRAVNIIKQRSTKGLSLEEIASAIGYSPTYFSKIFKKEVGMSFAEAVRLARIELAQYLIKTTSKSICEIAYEVGYADFPSFVRAFKKVTGMTPREYLLHHVPIV